MCDRPGTLLCLHSYRLPFTQLPSPVSRPGPSTTSRIASRIPVTSDEGRQGGMTIATKAFVSAPRSSTFSSSRGPESQFPGPKDVTNGMRRPSRSQTTTRPRSKVPCLSFMRVAQAFPYPVNLGLRFHSQAKRSCPYYPWLPSWSCLDHQQINTPPSSRFVSLTSMSRSKFSTQEHALVLPPTASLP